LQPSLPEQAALPAKKTLGEIFTDCILGKEVSANCTSVTISWLSIFCLALDKGFVEFV
jgi:hypothetical protein